MTKHVPIINVISSSKPSASFVEPGSVGDRGCVACGTVYQGQWYTQHGATATLVSDARGRYWCLDCAIDALANVRRRVDDRTSYVYPWRFEDVSPVDGQRVNKLYASRVAFAKAHGCPKCRAAHGNSWEQCEGDCPMPMSPHFNETTARAFDDVSPFDTEPES